MFPDCYPLYSLTSHLVPYHYHYIHTTYWYTISTQMFNLCLRFTYCYCKCDTALE